MTITYLQTGEGRQVGTVLDRDIGTVSGGAAHAGAVRVFLGHGGRHRCSFLYWRTGSLIKFSDPPWNHSHSIPFPGKKTERHTGLLFADAQILSHQAATVRTELEAEDGICCCCSPQKITHTKYAYTRYEDYAMYIPH